MVIRMALLSVDLMELLKADFSVDSLADKMAYLTEHYLVVESVHL